MDKGRVSYGQWVEKPEGQGRGFLPGFMGNMG